jgi:hypothetical protein
MIYLFGAEEPHLAVGFPEGAVLLERRKEMQFTI